MLSLPLNFCEVSRFVPPIGWTTLTNIMDKRQMNEWTDGWTDEEMRTFVRPSLRCTLTHTV